VRATVFEQGKVVLRTSPDPLTVSLTEAQADSLVNVGERMGARLIAWEGPTAVRVQQFVGAVRTRDLELEILPKLDAAATAADTRRSVLTMLGVAEDLDLKASEAVTYWQRDEPFIVALARLYCERLAEAIRRGLLTEYLTIVETLPHIRGKVHWAEQMKLDLAQRIEFNCSFDERSEDTLLNRTLKAGLLRAGLMLDRYRDIALVSELRHIMEAVSNARPTPEELARLRTSRLNRAVDPLLILAKLLLGNRNPDLGRGAQGDERSYAVVWDMNVLFERYIGRMAQRVLTGRAVDLQNGSAYLAEEVGTERRAFQLRPDILMSDRGGVVAVADTKWKRLDPQSHTLGVSEGDAYQAVAYARRFQSALAVLIYPHLPALGRPGRQRDFIVAASASKTMTLRVMTVDLARLDTVGQALQEGLTMPLSETQAS
jgi:5-methylcytosine-specific restriction enzyme subunit McrC